MKPFAFAALLLTLGQPAFAAQDATPFMVPELFNAGRLLVGLDQTKLVVEGFGGEVTMPPGLRRLGLPPKTEITVQLDSQMQTAANLLKVQIHRVEMTSLTIELVSGGFLAKAALKETQGPAVTTALGGQIDIKHLNASIFVSPVADNTGHLTLQATRVDIDSDYDAHGFPSVPFVLNGNDMAVKLADAIAKSVATDQIKGFLARPEIQKAVESGFLLYAGFATGEEWTHVTSLKISPQGIAVGVER
jgi:hypothetical protein